jgi:hypothetical protein
MAKAKITKVIKPNGDHFFYVYKNNSFERCFSFDPATTEINALRQAKETVKIIENDLRDSEETIYETKTDTDAKD